MEPKREDILHLKKKEETQVTDRENNTALFMLRCLELGISIADLDLITIGMVNDMWTEKANDTVKYDRIATQADFDAF